MNDLKLLTAHAKNLNAADSIAFISFDINMGTVYTSDHNKIYGIDTNNFDVGWLKIIDKSISIEFQLFIKLNTECDRVWPH